MTKVILSGCSGKMGKMISQSVNNFEGLSIVAGIDKFKDESLKYPIFENITECDVNADVVLDFSRPDALDSLLSYSKDNNLPVVLCTTGYSKEQLDRKSTRLNSSHANISYAVFCLKKKNTSAPISFILPFVPFLFAST